MGDERGGIYLALCYQIQNLLTVAAIHSARLEDEVLAIHIRQREQLRLVVHGNDGDDGIRTGTFPGQLEGVLTARYLHHHIGSPMLTVLPDECLAVLWLYNHHLRIMLLDEISSCLRFLADDDVSRILEHGAEQTADTRWAGTDNQHRILFRDF